MLLHHSPRSDVVMDDSRHSQLNDTIGYIFIGMTFELFFYGFSLAQTQYYFHVYPRDHKYLKALVAFLWLLDTVTACCDSSFLWYNVIDHHADIGSASHIIYTNAFNAEAFLSALIVLMTQLYFIYCIWRLMHGLIAPKWYHLSLILTMIAFALLSFCGGIACIYDMTQFPDETVLATADRTEVPALIQAVTAFVTDLFIAVALSIILHRKKTGFSRTDSVIAKLVIFAIQRGIITALIQLLAFTTYISTTFRSGASDLIWMACHLPVCKVYLNSLLALLNVRHWLRETMADDIELQCIEVSGVGSARN